MAYRASGGASVIHKARGRASNNRLIEGIREYAVELVRSNYADFGPSLASEMLLSKHALKVSRETLRQIYGPDYVPKIPAKGAVIACSTVKSA